MGKQLDGLRQMGIPRWQVLRGRVPEQQAQRKGKMGIQGWECGCRGFQLGDRYQGGGR